MRLILLPMTKDEAAKVRYALQALRANAFPQHRSMIDGVLANLDGATKDAAR